MYEAAITYCTLQVTRQEVNLYIIIMNHNLHPFKNSYHNPFCTNCTIFYDRRAFYHFL